MFHSIFASIEHWSLDYTVATNHYIAVTTWDLFCYLPWIVSTAFYGNIQRLKVGIDAVSYTHLTLPTIYSV